MVSSPMPAATSGIFADLLGFFVLNPPDPTSSVTNVYPLAAAAAINHGSAIPFPAQMLTADSLIAHMSAHTE